MIADAIAVCPSGQVIDDGAATGTATATVIGAAPCIATAAHRNSGVWL